MPPPSVGAPTPRLGGDGVEAPAQHDVHHALIGGVAVFERDLLRQDVDAQDGLGRDVLDLREARDAVAVEQDHRRLAAATAIAAGLRVASSSSSSVTVLTP